MDREKLLRLLEQRYPPKRDILSRVPLGIQADALWEELLSRRRARAAALPLYDYRGSPYWYVTTDRMIAASEKIVETLLENETDFDPYTDAPTVSTLEEMHDRKSRRSVYAPKPSWTDPGACSNRGCGNGHHRRNESFRALTGPGERRTACNASGWL